MSKHIHVLEPPSAVRHKNSSELIMTKENKKDRNNKNMFTTSTIVFNVDAMLLTGYTYHSYNDESTTISYSTKTHKTIEDIS
jgi:hypothetical protein